MLAFMMFWTLGPSYFLDNKWRSCLLVYNRLIASYNRFHLHSWYSVTPLILLCQPSPHQTLTTKVQSQLLSNPRPPSSSMAYECPALNPQQLRNVDIAIVLYRHPAFLNILKLHIEIATSGDPDRPVPSLHQHRVQMSLPQFAPQIFKVFAHGSLWNPLFFFIPSFWSHSWYQWNKPGVCTLVSVLIN